VNSHANQYSLVRISSFSKGAARVNNFDFLTTKKRVAMMNKKQPPLMHVARYVVLIPLIVAPMLAFTVSNEELAATSPIIVQKQASVQIKDSGCCSLRHRWKRSNIKCRRKFRPKENSKHKCIQG